jgi:hypothetical protein
MVQQFIVKKGSILIVRPDAYGLERIVTFGTVEE